VATRILSESQQKRVARKHMRGGGAEEQEKCWFKEGEIEGKSHALQAPLIFQGEFNLLEIRGEKFRF